MASEIRDALPGLLLEIGGQLVFEQVLHLRPEPTQIYFQFADCLLHLGLEQLSQFCLDLFVQLPVSNTAPPNQLKAAPPRQLLVKQCRSFFCRLVISALDFAHEGRHLPEHLLAPRLE